MALSKVLTLVESRGEGFQQVLSKMTPKCGKAYCVGITGPPGAGKSTLVDKLTHKFRAEGLKVGIVAVDPSSPFSGGALLGDRIRMQAHSGDSGVFIRSLGSRGSHGGLSRATRDIVRVMDAFGFDIIMVETVGVGQTELDIMEIADTTIVVLVPEAGDMVQSLKAGLLEIADIFVVNKSDRPGADQMVGHLQGLVQMSTPFHPRGGHGRPPRGWNAPVIKITAMTGVGIDELSEMIKNHQVSVTKDPKRLERQKEMRRAELIAITLERFEKILKEQLISNRKLAKLTDDVTEGKKSVYEAAEEILKKLQNAETQS